LRGRRTGRTGRRNCRDEYRRQYPPSYRRRIEEDIEGGDLSISDDNDIEPCVARRLAGRAGAPCEAPTVLNGLRRVKRRVDKARMSGAQLAGDLIQCCATDIAADGKKDCAVLGVEFFDGGAPSRWVALAEDLLEIAQQQRFDDIRHDRVPVRVNGPRAPFIEACGETPGFAVSQPGARQTAFRYTRAQSAKFVKLPGTRALAAAMYRSRSGPKYVCSAKYWNISRTSGAPG